MTYDVAKLKTIEGIDVEGAIKRFASHQAYFDALNDFIKLSKHYLRGYTAAVVLCNEDVRRDFLAETEKVRDTLTSLGMTGLAAALSDLDSAAEGDSVETLSDWLLRFYAEAENMAKRVASARTDVNDASPNAGKPIILAVDDKPELLSAIVNMLCGRFTVMAVTDGKAALKLIERHTPELFLLDIEMPQMNGYELAKLIRKHERFERSPIIFLTGKNTRSHVIAAIEHGGNDYILKPVDKNLLLNKIIRHLGI